MRTFRWNAPIIIGAGALVLSVFALAPLPLKAGESGADVTGAHRGPAAWPESSSRRRLDQSDRAAAMQALDLALSELGDGVTLVWRRPERGAGRPNQARLGLPRRPGPGLPPCRLLARARHLSAADRGRCVPGVRRLLVSFGVNGGFRCLKSVSPRLPLRAVRREGTRTEPARRRRKSGSRRCGRARSIPSRKCGSTGADPAVSPPFASAAGDGTKRLSSRRLASIGALALSLSDRRLRPYKAPSFAEATGAMADGGKLMAGKRGVVFGVANNRSIAWASPRP